jgi:phenylacetate-CoA ligase
MSPANLDHFVERIRTRRPAMLFGYPSSLSVIASHAGMHGIRLDNLGIKVAFVTSERLYGHQRTSIEQAFGCSVANGYGGRDAGFVAHQCPAGSMHVSAEDLIVEVLKPDGTAAAEGEAGELVVTHMATADFPFLRYRTGDIGALDGHRCACGRGLPILKELHGRSTDFVIAADGTLMHGLALIYILRDLPDIEQFKIIQESRTRTRVQIVPSSAMAESTENHIRNGFRARLGAEVQIDIERLPVISPEASGKHRYVVSHVTDNALRSPGA